MKINKQSETEFVGQQSSVYENNHTQNTDHQRQTNEDNDIFNAIV